MKDWQFYIALFFLVILIVPKRESYTANDITKMNEQLSMIVPNVQANVTATNLIISTPYAARPQVNAIIPVTQYTGATNFSTFFVNKDISFVSQNLLLLKSTAQQNATTLNIILEKLGSTEATLKTVTIPSRYSNKLNERGDFYENDLVKLKSDIEQLDQITDTNTNLIGMIRNKYYNGTLPDPPRPYPTLPFKLW